MTVKKKPILLFLLHLSMICLFAFGALVYAEELVAVKQKLYYALTAPSAGTEPEVIAPDPEAWYEDTTLIYHAGGAIDGIDYTNSREAVENSLSNGKHCLEIDFLFTRDRELVCAHSWEELFPDGSIPSAEEFSSMKIQDQFTPMTAAELIQIMKENPWMRLVVDTKEDNLYLVIAELVSLACEDPEILDRFIIQLYTGYEKAGLQAIYPFDRNQFLITLYKLGYWDQSLLRQFESEDIFILASISGMIPDEDVDLLRQSGYILYEYTVNQPEQAQAALNRGVHGLYTDSLTHSDLNFVS